MINSVSVTMKLSQMHYKWIVAWDRILGVQNEYISTSLIYFKSFVISLNDANIQNWINVLLWIIIDFIKNYRHIIYKTDY